MTQHLVSVIGLGKLGVCMAAAMAAKGHEVIGVDVNPDTVAKVNKGIPPVVEPNLKETMWEGRDRFMATQSYDEAITNSDISFVVVPTPSTPEGTFDITYAQRAFRSIGESLKKKAAPHTVVLTSTVLPGDTRYGCLPLLMQASGRKPGDGLSLCYSPEFIALGSVIHDFLNPDMLLIGEFDERSGDQLQKFYSSLMENHPQIHRMSIENAELAKISLNSYITSKITFANMIGSICERIPEGDCDAVLGAVGADSRVGKKYLRCGLGYGGPCFPRDNEALKAFAERMGVDGRMMKTIDAVNRSVPAHVENSIRKYLVGATRVLILGTSYKPASNLLEESQAFELAKILSQNSDGKQVDTWDPVAPCTLGLPPDYTAYSHIIIANMDPAFASLTSDAVEPGTVVVDLWRSHPHLDNLPHIRYIPLGKCRNDQVAAMKIVKGIKGVY